MVNIREIKVSDWDELKELIDDLINERPPVALEFEPLLMKGNRWIAMFPKGNLGHFLIALNKDMIIGFCYIAVPKFYQPIAYIGISVKKKFRNKDIGTKLFYEVALWAAGNNLQYLIADVWNWNLGSIKFFKKLNFEKKSEFNDKFKGMYKKKIRLVKKI